MKIEQYLKGGKVYVWKESFAIVKAKAAMPDAFAVIQDLRDITVIINQTKIKDGAAISMGRNWKLMMPLSYATLLPCGKLESGFHVTGKCRRNQLIFGYIA